MLEVAVRWSRRFSKLGSLLRFRPSQCGLKRSGGGEEPIGGRQDMVDEILRGGDGTPVEEGDPARQRGVGRASSSPGSTG